MNDDAVRATLLSLHLRILNTRRVTAALRDTINRTKEAIFASQDAIRRSDQILRSLPMTWADPLRDREKGSAGLEIVVGEGRDPFLRPFTFPWTPF